MSNQPLSEIVDGVRSECGHSLSRAVGLNDDSAVRNQINRTQNWLWHNYEWPQARGYREERLRQQEKIYTFPEAVDPHRVDSVWCSDGIYWTAVDYLIEPFHESHFSSTFPVLRWQHFHGEQVNSSPQYEVWPVPDRGNERLRFYGVLLPTKMRADSDVSSLDGDLIIWFTASRILTAQGSPDAQLVTQMAESHLSKLRGAVGSNAQAPFVIGGGDDMRHRDLRPGIDYVSRHR